MNLEQATKRYAELAVKQQDNIPFTKEEQLEWIEVCDVVFDDLLKQNEDIFIRLKDR